MFNSALKTVNITVDKNEKIKVFMPGYLRNLSNLIQDVLTQENGKR